MATSRAENSEFHRFSSLRRVEQTAIILRSGGKSWPELTAILATEHPRKKPYAETTLRMWFIPGGRLEAAYDEYNDQLAEQALKNAKKAAKRAAEAGIGTMIEMMTDKHEDAIRLQAAWRLTNKYVPDRMINITEPGGEADLPPELVLKGEAIVNGTNDAPTSG